MSRWKSIQLGWKKFNLEVNGDGSYPSITLAECGDFLHRSVTLIGFEVEWFGKKLREASFKSGGDLFLGSLRGKVRWVRIYRVQNKRGRFVEIEVRGSRMRRVVRIPEDGQGKGWSQLQNQLVKLVQKTCNHGKDGRQSYFNKISMKSNREFNVPWLAFKEAIDKFQQSLGRCCSGSFGSFPTVVTIGLGRWSFEVPISAVSLAKQALSGSSDNHIPPENFITKPVARDGRTDRLRGVNFHVIRGVRAAASSTRTDLNFKFENSKWVRARTQNKIWVKTGVNLGVSNGDNNYFRATSKCGSGVVKSFIGANKCSPSELSFGNPAGDKSGVPGPTLGMNISPSKAEESVKSEVASLRNNRWWALVDLEKNGEEVVGCNEDGDGLEVLSPKSCRPFTADEDDLFVAKFNDGGESLKLEIENEERVATPSSLLDGSEVDEGALNGGEDVSHGEKELFQGVEPLEDLEKVSYTMHLKRLRARKILKGRFWFSNRLDFFRAQRRCGSLRMKNLIFGA